MTKKISRRDFLKIATGAAVATGFASKVRRVILEPYVRPPEETLPGKASWYASTCRQCPAGCGIIVRTINGRAKKIEGNPNHPLNRGKLCARGQAGLQTLYNPDRLKGPVQQSGGRGSKKFEPLYWPDALELLAEKITLLGSPSRLAFLGGLMPDHLHDLVNRWLEALGAPPPVMFDLLTALEGRTTIIQGSETLFGVPQYPVYDIQNADVIFSFGANFLETWGSPVSYNHAFGEFRQGQSGGRGFFAHFEPRLSATGALADEWVPLRPGTDGLVALAIGRIIIENNLGTVGAFTQKEANLYQDVEVGALAEASGVSMEKLERLANIIASANRALVIPGGYPLGHQNGHAAFQAIQALNLILRRFGQRGGVFLSSPVPVDTLPSAGSPDSFQSVQDLIKRMQAGEIDLLLVHGINPVYELPAAVGFAEAIRRVPYVISFSPFVDETTVWADLIMPDHTYLEAWGYQVPSPGADRPIVSSQQPIVRPLYDTHSTADVILALAARQGGSIAESLPWADEVLFLEDASGVLFGSSLSAYSPKSAGAFWAAWRQNGGWWSEGELRQEPEPIGFPDNPLSAANPMFEGEKDEFPLHLYPYASLGLSDGRGANLPWLQEMPDPMTTARWETWIEINPQTAHELSVEDNDVVRILSPYGEIEAIVVVFPGIRPDVVAIPIGQGHTEFGRYAKGRGVNPMDLLAPASDQQTGALAWGATRVRVIPTGRKYTLARLESLDGEGRETIR
jgi:anaerobic selenocysteine-containing dehydrogenase